MLCQGGVKFGLGPDRFRVCIGYYEELCAVNLVIMN